MAVLTFGFLLALSGSLGWLLFGKTSLIRVLSGGALYFVCVSLGSVFGSSLLMGAALLVVNSSEPVSPNDLFLSIGQWE